MTKSPEGGGGGRKSRQSEDLVGEAFSAECINAFLISTGRKKM